MEEQEFNPFVPKWQLIHDRVNPTITTSTTQNEVLYTQEEYDKVYAVYQQEKMRADALQNSFLAIADIMYEMLAYLNAARLFHGAVPLMATDINAVIENNPILNELCNELRETSIKSGIGVVSELQRSQEHLRQEVMLRWKEKMKDPNQRSIIERQLFGKEKSLHTARDELF